MKCGLISRVSDWQPLVLFLFLYWLEFLDSSLRLCFLCAVSRNTTMYNENTLQMTSTITNTFSQTYTTVFPVTLYSCLMISLHYPYRFLCFNEGSLFIHASSHFWCYSNALKHLSSLTWWWKQLYIRLLSYKIKMILCLEVILAHFSKSSCLFVNRYEGCLYYLERQQASC